jgi:hypothetical protein
MTIRDAPIKPRKRSENIQEQVASLECSDLRLLQWLLQYPLQRADDLALGVARWMSRASVYRHLDALQQRALVESVLATSSGDGKRLYYLSNLGLYVLAASLQVTPRSLAQQWQADDHELLKLLPRLSTLLTIQHVVNGLVAHAADALTEQGRRPSLVRWNWRRNFTHAFAYREQPMRWFADGALALCIRATLPDGGQHEQWYSLLMLYTHLHDERLMRLRLESIMRWRESAERWPFYQHMPLVLILATSPRQCEHWQHAAEEVAVRFRLEPLLGVIACLPENTIAMGAIGNPWLLSWRSLVEDASCHLQELLMPLPLQAIPVPLQPNEDDTEAEDESQPQLQAEGVCSSHSTRIRTIIAGNLASRLNRITSIVGNDERERMALLAGMRLSPRLWGLLHLLLEHPLLNIDEMSALLSLKSRSVRSFLYALRSLGCIEAIQTEVGQRWYLSASGLRMHAAAEHIDVRNLAVTREDEPTALMQRGLEWLLHHSEHTAGVYGFFAALSRAASEQREGDQHHALLWWETGAACERRYHVQNQWYNLRPDALAEYMVDNHHFRFWLEWDRGTMNVHDLTIKFTSYAQYIASREWARERSVLPMLLCVAPDIAQEKRMQRVAQATLCDIQGLVMKSTTAVLLVERGPLDGIWSECLPCHNQSSSLSSPRQLLFQKRN